MVCGFARPELVFDFPSCRSITLGPGYGIIVVHLDLTSLGSVKCLAI